MANEWKHRTAAPVGDVVHQASMRFGFDLERTDRILVHVPSGMHRMVADDLATLLELQDCVQIVHALPWDSPWVTQLEIRFATSVVDGRTFTNQDYSLVPTLVEMITLRGYHYDHALSGAA